MLPRGNAASRALAATLIVLIGLAAVYAAWPVWRAFLPLEIDANEPWNAYRADAVRLGQALYPDPSGLVINNYPPLSFNLIAAIAAAGIDPLYAGRLLSLLAMVAAASAIGCLIRQFGGSRTAALVGAVWFCATLTRFIDDYAVMNDPSLPAIALMAWALSWLIHRTAASRSPDPAIILMAVAGFYKHNLLAVPATAICWLMLHDRRAGLRALLPGMIAVALGLVVCRLVYGDAFLKSLLVPRQHNLEWALQGLGRLQWIAPATAIWGLWAWHQRGGEAVRFTGLFFAIALPLYFLQKLGFGVADSAQFELLLATAVGLGLAYENIAAVPAPHGFGPQWQRAAIVLVLIARLLISLRTAPYLLIVSPEFRVELNERAEIAKSEAARIRAIPGPVVCSVTTTCRLAGKPLLTDEFFIAQSIATGRRSREEVERLKRALGARWEEVDRRAVLDIR